MGLSDLSKTATATIANGSSLSDAVAVSGYRVGAILMPSAWTSASLTFRGSADGTNFFSLYDADGNELTVPNAAATSRGYIPTVQLAHALLPFREIKVRSGTSGSAVNQGAERAITLVLVPRGE